MSLDLELILTCIATAAIYAVLIVFVVRVIRAYLEERRENAALEKVQAFVKEASDTFRHDEGTRVYIPSDISLEKLDRYCYRSRFQIINDGTRSALVLANVK